MSNIEYALPRPKEKLLANGNFLILWLGQLVSQFGDMFFRFALTIWVMRTSGTTALAGIMMVASIPGIILGPIAGTLVDNLDRKKIIVLSDLFRGGITLAAAWIMYRQNFAIGHVYLLLVLFGLVSPLFDSAVSASTPNIVRHEHLTQANSLRQATASGAGLVGPALAAIILAALGGMEAAVPVFFALNGVSYILSGISEIFLKLPVIERVKTANAKEAVSAFKRQLAEGVRYIWDSRMLARIFIVLAVVNFFMAPLMQVIVPAVIIDMFNLDEVWLGFIQSGVAGGFMLASLTLASMKKIRLSKLFLIAVLALGLAVMALGLAAATPSFFSLAYHIVAATMIPIAVVIGATAAMTNISLSTIMQKVVPDEKRGRVFGCLNTIAGGLMPISLGMTGLFIIAVPLYSVPLLASIAIISASVLLGKIKELQQY